MHGLVDPVPDLVGAGPPPLPSHSMAAEAEIRAELEARFGAGPAGWLLLWSPHHHEFAPENILSVARAIREVGPFVYVESNKPFAAIGGAVPQVLVVAGDEVHAFIEPSARVRAFASLVGAAPDAEDAFVLELFERLTGVEIERAEPGDDAPRDVRERWRAPSPALFFANVEGTWVEASVEDGRVSVELL